MTDPTPHETHDPNDDRVRRAGEPHDPLRCDFVHEREGWRCGRERDHEDDMPTDLIDVGATITVPGSHTAYVDASLPWAKYERGGLDAFRAQESATGLAVALRDYVVPDALRPAASRRAYPIAFVGVRLRLAASALNGWLTPVVRFGAWYDASLARYTSREVADEVARASEALNLNADAHRWVVLDGIDTMPHHDLRECVTMLHARGWLVALSFGRFRGTVDPEVGADWTTLHAHFDVAGATGDAAIIGAVRDESIACVGEVVLYVRDVGDVLAGADLVRRVARARERVTQSVEMAPVVTVRPASWSSPQQCVVALHAAASHGWRLTLHDDVAADRLLAEAQQARQARQASARPTPTTPAATPHGRELRRLRDLAERHYIGTRTLDPPKGSRPGTPQRVVCAACGVDLNAYAMLDGTPVWYEDRDATVLHSCEDVRGTRAAGGLFWLGIFVDRDTLTASAMARFDALPADEGERDLRDLRDARPPRDGTA